jgi:hypothetical protein
VIVMLRGSALSALVVLVIAVAGCGSSDSTSTQSSSSATSAAKKSARPSVLRTEPAPLPAGTPPAPAGLARTGGYDTYELCRGNCAGHVPASLRRPLHLPRRGGTQSCSVSAGATPVSIAGGPRLTAQRFVGSHWMAAHVTWHAAVGYHGPILIRGRRLGGEGVVGFGEGHEPYDELQLLESGRGEAMTSDGGRAWLSLTRVQHPGCYAYQVDGTDFSRVIVFRVRA